MTDISKNIYPIFSDMVQREEKEKLLNQNSKVFWFTGLSGAGKSTIAKSVSKALHEGGIHTMLLDGDNLRSGLCKDLTFEIQDREENIRRAAEVAKLFFESGTVTLCSFITPTIQIREMVKSIIGAENLINVYVKASLNTCIERDVKGIYAKALKGEIQHFTGVNSPFDEFDDAELIVETDKKTLEESLSFIMEKIWQIVRR